MSPPSTASTPESSRSGLEIHASVSEGVCSPSARPSSTPIPIAPSQESSQLADSNWPYTYVDRMGMGELGILSIELILMILHHLPFHQRLLMILLVSKSFQGLITEKSLWHTVEVCKQVSARTLLRMVTASDRKTLALLPEGCISGLDMSLAEGFLWDLYCSMDQIEIIKALSSRKHELTSIVARGYWMEKFVYTLQHHARVGGVDLSRITTLKLTGREGSSSYNIPPTEYVAALLSSMPELMHLTISGHDQQSSIVPVATVDLQVLQELAVVGAKLRTLLLGCWAFTNRALGHLGQLFPGLEAFECHIITTSVSDGDYYPPPYLMDSMPELAEFKMSGYDRDSVDEFMLSGLFFFFLYCLCPNLRVLEWRNRFNGLGALGAVVGEEEEEGSKKVDLFKVAREVCEKHPGDRLVSLGLRKVVLEGWAEIEASELEKVWHCPNVVEAPWVCPVS